MIRKTWKALFAKAVGTLVCVFVFSQVIKDRLTFEVQWQKSVTSGPIFMKTTTLRARQVDSYEIHEDGLEFVGTRGLRRSKNEGAWYAMGDKEELFVYSAHYDDRAALQGPPVVRVIGVSIFDQDSRLYCVTWYEDGRKSTIRAEIYEVGAGVYRYDTLYIEFMITCNLDHKTKIPSHVSIVAERSDTPTFAVPVEIADTYKRTEEIGICVSLSYWHIKPSQLVEWIEFQRLMGVAGIIIYNNSLSVPSQNVFKFYESQDGKFLELRQSRNFVPFFGETTFHFQMAPVINDCMYRYRNRFHAILVIDFDEFLIPSTANTFKSMVSQIFNEHTEPHPGYTYSFRNAYFFYDFAPKKKQPKELVTLRYTKRTEYSEEGYSSKSMIGTNTCIAMHNHYCWKVTPIVENSYEYSWTEISPDIAVLHHYKRCHLEEEECRELFKKETEDLRMLRFADKLKRAVNAKRFLLGMHLVSK